MDEISHMNFPDVGDLWTIEGLPVLIVLCTTDSGVRVCTQKERSDPVAWDLSYVQELSLREFRQKLTHSGAAKDNVLARVHPGVYADYVRSAV